MCRVLPLSPNPLGQEDGSLRQADLVRQEDGACPHGRHERTVAPREQTVAPPVGPQSAEEVTGLRVTGGDMVKSANIVESEAGLEGSEGAELCNSHLT